MLYRLSGHGDISVDPKSQDFCPGSPPLLRIFRASRKLRAPSRSGGMADAADSKSAIFTGVRVQVPPSAPPPCYHPGMARRPRLDAPQQLGAVLLHARDARPPAHVDAPPVAPQDWELAVGTKIARRARPTRLERGVLHIRTATSTWAQELSLLADTIVQQLRARGLAVKALRFHVGAVEPLKRPAWRSETRAAPEPSPLPADVRVVLAAVPDGDLRDVIARAAAASLGYERARPAPGTAAPAPRGKPATSPRSADPAPRSAASRSAPPDRKSPARRAAPRGSRAGSSGRGP